MNLFIIGNGFDLAHRLATSYQEFREYLLKENNDINLETFVKPEGVMLPDGDIHYDEDKVLAMLIFLIDEAETGQEEWNDVETSLAHLNFDEAFDVEHYDEDGDLDYWRMASLNDQIANDLVIPTSTIQSVFSNWVNTIKTSSATAKLDFKKLIKKDDQFLTFNYTDTLETVYKINKNKVVHIHGKQDEKIHFGHGDSNDYSEEYLASNVGSEDGLNKINEQLRKKTEIAIEDNIEFFINLATLDIKYIYSYGFSFNEVDKVYLEKIFEEVNTDEIVWKFNDYDSSETIKKFKTTLINCGFTGGFDAYSIND